MAPAPRSDRFSAERLAELTYTVLLRPRPLRWLANTVIKAVLPSTVRYGEARVHLNPADPVVSGALTFRVYEQRELAFVGRYCRAGTIFVDVGANVGVYSAVASHRVGDEGRVYAFEPDPQSWEFLRRTIAANHPTRVTAVQAALGDEPGRATLYASKDNRGDNRLVPDGVERRVDAIDVEVLQFDAWAGRQAPALAASPLFVKIDVQGFEGRVLRGMAGTLGASERCVLMMELWPEGQRKAGVDPAALLAELRGWGFELYTLGTSETLLDPLTDDLALIEAHPGRAYTNVVGLKGVAPAAR